MYECATSSLLPLNLIALATTQWQKSKSRHQHFEGHLHTMPTQTQWALKHLDIVIGNKLCLYLRTVEQELITKTIDETKSLGARD